MPKRTINAKEILADIKAGMSDSALMEKHRLTEKGLQSLFKKLMDANVLQQCELDIRGVDMMVALLKVKDLNKEILADIKAGMNDSALMEKYGLSEKGLQNVFRKHVTLKAISHSELYERSKSYRERIDHIRKRKSPRAELTIHVPIYDLQSGDKGILRDISENGLRVAGIEARVGQAKTFQIPVDMFVESDPLLVMAECKWVEIRQGGKEYLVTGFEITDLSESDSEILQNFIGWLLFSESGQWQTID